MLPRRSPQDMGGGPATGQCGRAATGQAFQEDAEACSVLPGHPGPLHRAGHILTEPHRTHLGWGGAFRQRSEGVKGGVWKM